LFSAVGGIAPRFFIFYEYTFLYIFLFGVPPSASAEQGGTSGGILGSFLITFSPSAVKSFQNWDFGLQNHAYFLLKSGIFKAKNSLKMTFLKKLSTKCTFLLKRHTYSVFAVFSPPLPFALITPSFFGF
jgi:hypothetical protein